MNYQDFLKSKRHQVKPSGVIVADQNLPDCLFDYQKYVVKTALERGKFATFLDTGMGKALIAMTWADFVYQWLNKPVIILAPLAVAQQFANIEAPKFGFEVNYCDSQDDVINGINITNYEKLQKFDTSIFCGVVLDESSILKSFAGKVRTSIIESFSKTPYKLACSATPAPNDPMELGNHVEFLGIMSYNEFLATFFVHDGGNTSKWRLKKHAQSKDYPEFLHQWCVMARRPSDLGFSDGNFNLPKLIQHEIKIETGIKKDGELFVTEAHGLKEQRQAKRLTLEKRVDAVAKLVNSSNEQWLIFCDLNDESKALYEDIQDAVEVKGSDKDKHKINSALKFVSGDIRVLVSKPKIFGFGLNFQHCHNVVFVGLNNSFEAIYQAIRRCWRFGQTQDVNAYFVCADIEGNVLKNIQRKQEQFNLMHKTMVNTYQQMTGQTKRLTDSYQVQQVTGKNYTLFNGDSCEIIKDLNDNSIDFSIFSPPFTSLYTYSNSERDMGNSINDEQFFKHFKFLVQELHRVIKNGRLVSVHCMDMPILKQDKGYVGVYDFPSDIIRLFESVGFVLHSKVTIWKNPVTAMQRTHSIRLLHAQLKKDSAMSGNAIPDYLVTFRKLGENEKPIRGLLDVYYGINSHEITEKDETRKSIEIWQRYASPVWMDINPSDTLQYRQARENDDERHICPLQLGVIRRALQLWTNPNDLVLSPFTGIGSEGYASLDMDRKFVGIELKKSYFECAQKNLDYIENKPKQLSLLEKTV